MQTPELPEPPQPKQAPDPKSKWYYSDSSVITGAIIAGIFALPLVWKNPRYKPITKTAVTVVIVSITALLCYFTGDLCSRLIKQLNALSLY